MEVTELLNAHVDRLNSAVVSGGFDEMVAHFSEDAVMSFEGVPVSMFERAWLRRGQQDAAATPNEKDEARRSLAARQG